MGKRAIYYDTETTGIKFNRDSIIELAAYDATEDRTFSSLINPGVPIPPEATAIHNITDEMVADSPSFKEVAEKFSAFCGEDCILIAHNNDSFDKIFIETEYKRAEVPFPSFLYLDTLKWSRKYRNDLPRHNLQTLREVYGIPANQAHRALDDVMVLHAIFSQMIDDLTIEQAYALMQEPMVVKRMPFGKHQGKMLTDVPKNYLLWLKESGALDKESNRDLYESLEKLGLLENQTTKTS